ncbi:MAG TPA: cellulase family glycosylhydrolase [Solirubrobacteraceae bacterium]|nr:cellulase family glycosylhydrolase [Solirubrobacteraceae bacterium]
MRRVLLGGLAVLLWLVLTPLVQARFVHSPNLGPGSIRVAGNQLVNGNGTPIQLRGVNRSGTEYACFQGSGIFDGPSDAASVRAIASWRVNVVRIPLNEDCWLGINGIKRPYSGPNYRRAIISYVGLLHRYGMYAELSLMWGAPRNLRAGYQPPAPDESHSPAMWASMAATFRNDDAVILAPWGETTLGWACFMRTGCRAKYGAQQVTYRTASMQQAVDRMRAAGYPGVIAIPCINYANACGKQPDGSLYRGSSWLLSHPKDPARQLIAEAHVYGKNVCDTTACFDSSLAPITQVVPLIFAETGETYDASSCGSRHITAFLNWADHHGVGYEAWAWDASPNCHALITNYNGTPRSGYGRAVRAHFRARTGTQ